MKPVQVGDAAAVELAEAVRWYEERRPGWGARLFDAVTSSLHVIERFPEAGAMRPGVRSSRQLLVRGFPYLVVYQERFDATVVVALAHTSRKPGYWKVRR